MITAATATDDALSLLLLSWLPGTIVSLGPLGTRAQERINQYSLHSRVIHCPGCTLIHLLSCCCSSLGQTHNSLFTGGTLSSGIPFTFPDFNICTTWKHTAASLWTPSEAAAAAAAPPIAKYPWKVFAAGPSGGTRKHVNPLKSEEVMRRLTLWLPLNFFYSISTTASAAAAAK